MSAVLEALPSVVHLLRDEPAPIAHASNRLLLPEELAAVGSAMTALAENEAAQKNIDEQFVALRGAEQTAAAVRAKRAKLTGDSEELKAAHERLRGTARMAHLDALEAATKRAATEYVAAARLFGESAAKYIALGTLRDEWLGTSRFDPMGLWALVGSGLAPEPHHRPRHCTVVSDRFQRACVWTVDSPAHAEQVRSAKAKFTTELQAASNGAHFPF